MPGIWGATAEVAEVGTRLHEECARAWNPAQCRRAADGGVVGGHTFGPPCVGSAPDGALWGVDGERRAYAAAPAGPGAPVPGGNLVWLGPDAAVSLLADDAGALPLYYAVTARGLAFSSLLRPLARALGASPDPVGIAEYLRFAFTYAGRTVFEGIRRVAPGQRVRWDPRSGVTVEERASTWVGVASDLDGPGAAAEMVAPLLRHALRATAAGADAVLMTSAGWDSRTLLAGASDPAAASSLTGFFHGDLASREARIAQAMCRRVGVPFRSREIGPDVWDPEHLERAFERVESLVFPHWSWASRANADKDCILSGVLGEVLGGHYGATQVHGAAAGKALALLGGLKATDEAVAAGPESVFEQVRVRALDRPWYLRAEVEGDRPDLLDRINDDIRDDLTRLRRRGIATSAQLLEAFVTEHRGVQYIAAQACSTRLATDIAIPFGERALLAAASRIPAHLKIHNRVNRALMRSEARALSGFPTAAVLVPSSWPLLAQEASRAARRAYEDARWALYVRSRGRGRPPRLGWVDFEFLRDGHALAAAADSLTAPLWDRGAFARLIRDARSFAWRGSMHPVFDQMGKIMTVDRWLS